MRGGRIVGAAVAGAVIVAGALGLIYRDEIRVALALRRCNAAWEKVRDYQSDFRVDVELGPLNPSVRGRIAYRKPDAYRLDLGGGETPNCRVFASGRTAWVYFPSATTAVEVEFAGDELASVVGSQSPEPWLDQVSQATSVQWVGRGTVDDRTCKVLELVPPPGSTEAGAAAVTPALGRRFDDVPFVGDWKRTRVYLDDETGLPVRGDALKHDGDSLFTWTASHPQVNRGLAPEDLRFEPPEGVRVLKRQYDPAHPERFFLPPAKGRSLLRQLGDALEEGAQEYLKGQAEGQGKSLGEHVLDGLTH